MKQIQSGAILLLSVMLGVAALAGCAGHLPYQAHGVRVQSYVTAETLQAPLDVRLFDYEPPPGITQTQVRHTGCLPCAFKNRGIDFDQRINSIAHTEMKRAAEYFTLGSKRPAKCQLAGVIHDVYGPLGNFSSDITYVLKAGDDEVYKKRIVAKVSNRPIFGVNGGISQILADTFHSNIADLLSTAGFREQAMKSCSI